MLNFNSRASEIDMDYFQTLIKQKMAAEEAGSYQDQMAAKQMMQDFDPEEELTNALDEIRKNEKEMSIVAMVAQTLIERNEELQEKLQANQAKVDHL